VADDTRQHQRIMVPVGGNPIDSETVRVAVWLAKQSSSKLYAIHIIEVNRSLPLGAVIDKDIERGEQILDEVDRLATESAQEVETELVQARETGPAIVDEAEEWGADLIVMGLPYKRRFGEFNLGRTVPYVLKNASCRVILFRERRDSR
jgi:nucleotide-binding universal stress UspA family protein